MDLVRKLVRTSDASCGHMPTRLATPTGDRCEECGSGHSLRMCATCGHVGCCDSQAGHARIHYHETGHEVMASVPVGRGFLWCYPEDRYVR